MAPVRQTTGGKGNKRTPPPLDICRFLVSNRHRAFPSLGVPLMQKRGKPYQRPGHDGIGQTTYRGLLGIGPKTVYDTDHRENDLEHFERSWSPRHAVTARPVKDRF